MIVIRDLKTAYSELDSSVVALGNFDGVHKGHQMLISKAVELAKQNNCKSVVFTFDELPINVIANKTVVKSIQKTEEKIDTIASLGVDYLVCVAFDDFMRTMSPEDFCGNVLVHDLKCKIAVCGFNYSFGNMGCGNPEKLISLGKVKDFEVNVIPEYDLENTLVSSSNIRKFLELGDVEKFEEFTGRNYTISGKVMYGQQLGNRMGFPTANLSLDPNMAHPGNGVYVTHTYIDGRKYNSVTNVGHKPTVGEFEKNAETHIFDFNENIYGDFVIVEFVKMLRPERKFNSIDVLSRQIAEDCEKAREVHKEQGRI